MKNRLILGALLFIMLFLHGCNNSDSEKKIYITLDYGEERVVEFNENDLIDLFIPEKENFKFAGWYYDLTWDKPFDNKNLPKETNFKLYAKWISFQSVFMYEDKDCLVIDNILVINNPPAQEENEKYILYWTKVKNNLSTIVNFPYELTENTILYPYYEQESSFNLHLTTDSKAEIRGSGVFKEGQLITISTSLEDEDYVFEGWYNSNNILVSTDMDYSFEMPKVDYELKAKWIKLVNINVAYEYLDGTTEQICYKAKPNEVYEIILDTKYIGYEAVWSLNQGFIYCGDVIYIYAWKDSNYQVTWRKKRYRISFETDGGESIDNIYVSYLDNIKGIRSSYKEGFVFKNWYDEDGNLFLTGGVFYYARDLVLYAVYAEEKIADDKFYYEYNSKLMGYEISAIDPTTLSGDLIIPSIYNDLPVVGVANEGFRNSLITSLYVPESVVNIGEAAFFYCSNLKTVTLTNVKNLDNYAFKNNGSLMEINLNEGLENIGLHQFMGNSSLRYLEIPSSVKYISQSALFGARCSIVNFLGENPPILVNDSNYSSYPIFIIVPKGYSTIYKNAYQELKNYIYDSQIIISNDLCYVPYLDGFSVFARHLSIVGSIEIPSFIGGKPVRKIENFGFQWCASLTSITIPATVKEVGSLAFGLCTNLSNVIFSEGLLSIGESSFSGCSNLSEITLPASLIEIGETAFAPGGYGYGTEVQSNMKLKTVNFAENSKLEKIGNSAFFACYLIESLCLPSSINFIGEFAFFGIQNLKDFYFENNSNEFYQIIDGALYSGDGRILMTYAAGLSAKTFTALASTVEIAERAFFCANLLEEIVLPSSVNYIGKEAFFGCASLIFIDIPNYVKIIEEGTFSNCFKLKNITLSNELEKISRDAFNFCLQLESIIIPSKVVLIDTKSFYNCQSLKEVIFSANSALKTINYNAFMYCKNLTKVIIPEGVSVIQSDAFANCYNLMNVFLPKGIEVMGENIFDNYNASIFCEECQQPENWNQRWTRSHNIVWGYEIHQNS